MNEKTIYRVRFFEREPKQTLEALVRRVEPSEFPGLVCFRDFVFRDNQKKIVLPEEDAASKRFRQTQTLHIPYHNIISIEEILDEPLDVRNLPFLREVDASPSPEVREVKARSPEVRH